MMLVRHTGANFNFEYDLYNNINVNIGNTWICQNMILNTFTQVEINKFEIFILMR